MKNNRYVRVKLRKEKNNKNSTLQNAGMKSASNSSDDSYEDSGFNTAMGARPYQRSHWINFDKFEKEDRERRDKEKKKDQAKSLWMYAGNKVKK